VSVLGKAKERAFQFSQKNSRAQLSRSVLLMIGPNGNINNVHAFLVIKPSPMKEISSFRNLFRGIDLPPYTIRAPYLPVLPVPGATTLSPQEIDAAISAHDTGMYLQSCS